MGSRQDDANVSIILTRVELDRVRVVLADASLVKPREPAAFGMRQGTTRRDAPRSSRAADSRVALTSTPMKLLSMGWSLAFMWAACARAPSAVRGKL